MERLSKTKASRLFSYSFLILLFLISPISSLSKSPDRSDRALEEKVLKALGKSIQGKKIEVQIGFANEKANVLKTLTVKFDGINLGQIVADHMTLVYEDPVIDLIQLNREKELNILSYSKNKVGILISPGAIEGYFDNKAKQINKKYNRISIKFSPPYIECLFDVPAHEISQETLQLLNKFVKGAKVEGYAAFEIRAKNNALYAFSSKVIVNHFLLPNLILQELQTKFNPFDDIPVLKPFKYSINTVAVQNKYLFLTN